MGTTVLRRLNREELNNTLKDLLGDDSRPADLLPADARVHGYDTNADALSTSAPMVEQLWVLLEGVAARVEPTRLVACDVAERGEEGCAGEFIRTFGTRALRRPPTADEQASLLGLYTDVRTRETHEGALRAVLTRLLMSPDFLYHVELGDEARGGLLEDHALASRLSYLLWETMPDDALFRAAADGRLRTDADVEAQVSRMLQDDRARRVLVRFFGQWLGVDRLSGVQKDPAVYPGFDTLRASMRGEFDRFVEDVVWTGNGTLQTLLTASYTYVDAALAPIYGVQVEGAGFSRVDLDPGVRAGVLTQAAFLSAAGRATGSSPIRRGAFVRERLLCAPLPPPPPGAGSVPEGATVGTTTRAFFDALTRPPTCSGCHSQLNPIGFGFEGFDGIGGARTHENGHPVDTSGALTAGDRQGPFTGAVELMHLLASSDTVRRCLATHYFRFRFGRMEQGGDAAIIEALASALRGSGDRLKTLASALARHPAARYAHMHPSLGVAP